MSEKRSQTPAEVTLVTLTILFTIFVLYLALRGVLFLAPKHVDERYACYYADGPSVVEVRLHCPLRHEVYVDLISPKLLGSTPKCTVVDQRAFPPGAPVATAANVTVRAVRVPDGTYTLEAPNGTAPALCFKE